MKYFYYYYYHSTIVPEQVKQVKQEKNDRINETMAEVFISNVRRVFIMDYNSLYCISFIY